MHLEGLGFDKNDKEAAILIQKAAENECAEAQNQLGLMHLIGNAVEINEKEAVNWIRRAATNGYGKAQ